ncbi:MAG: hypothetical protein V3V00_02075 [Saprospiraceae bacterium]
MDLLRRNNLWIGMVLALIFSVMFFGIVLMLFEFGEDMGLIGEIADPMKGRRFRTTTLITICGNMVLIKLFNRRYTQETLRGILIVTFALAVVWLGMFHQEVFADF